MAKFPIHGVSCENIKVFDIPQNHTFKEEPRWTLMRIVDGGLCTVLP